MKKNYPYSALDMLESDQAMKRIFAHDKWCIDCKLCEVACKTAHSKTGDIIKALRFENPAPQSRVHVEGGLEHSMAVQCRHCDSPECVKACITSAMQKDPETGLVSVDANKCINCFTCVVACPFGCVAPIFEDDGVKISKDYVLLPQIAGVEQNGVIKCDMCANRTSGEKGVPACVEICPNRALEIVEVEVA